MRRAGQPDQSLGSIDSTPQTPSFHLQPYLDGNLAAPAIPAQPGDALLLHITYVSGAAGFTVLETRLTIP